MLSSLRKLRLNHAICCIVPVGGHDRAPSDRPRDRPRFPTVLALTRVVFDLLKHCTLDGTIHS